MFCGIGPFGISIHTLKQNPSDTHVHFTYIYIYVQENLPKLDAYQISIEHVSMRMFYVEYVYSNTYSMQISFFISKMLIPRLDAEY